MGAPVPTPVIAEVQLGSFRCFQSARLEPGAGINVVAGQNASGKTSLLEALYFLGRGSSFRAARAESVIQFEAERSILFARLGLGTAGRVGLEISRAEGLDIRIDGSPGVRADLARALPVQLLDPSSHELISGAPAGRRQFMDWGVFHVEHGFLGAWQRYRRALQQRNAALKDRDGSSAWLWDESLVADGELVDACRRRFLALLKPQVQAVGDRLLEADIDIEYRPGWPDGESLAEALVAGRERDLRMATSGSGPHRADLAITVRHRRARDTVSRGQEKLVAAALTLGQLNLVAESRGQNVVLLVDEPAADLDREHLSRLFCAIAEAPVQAFVSSLDPSALRLPAVARQFHVEHGQVQVLL